MPAPKLVGIGNTAAEMAEAVALYLQEGHDTMDRSALRRRGFTDREIADHGDEAVKEGRALYRKRCKATRGRVVPYLPFERFRRPGQE